VSLRRAAALGRPRPSEPPALLALLALDWAGGCDELLVGRHLQCDVVVSHPSVSRTHARLSFRDGHWVLRDLDSTNGTRVNGRRVGRCRLEPGDRLSLGSADLLVD
jgi:pSer/pThr/pTyr-binding forkhead associated (FHA) protein